VALQAVNAIPTTMLIANMALVLAELTRDSI
jgi:hypothetical protein